MKDIETLLQGPIDDLKGEKSSSLPNLSYSLHNYNLKYFLIRQLLEQKDFEEISSMRQKLQMQSIKSGYFEQPTSKKSAKVKSETNETLNEEAVWNDYRNEI